VPVGQQDHGGVAVTVAVALGRLDMGDWSVLVGGFALAGLVLFLTYPVAA
jgi:hypothetical protein